MATGKSEYESSSPPNHIGTAPKAKLDPKDVNNSDLVHRLLAATPAYLYSASLAPHNFFFSEMLRSIVQAKEQGLAMSAQHPLISRRPRKRLWNHQLELTENGSELKNSNRDDHRLGEKQDHPSLFKIESTSHRHGSAFSVPIPSARDKYHIPINLCTNSHQQYPSEDRMRTFSPFKCSEPDAEPQVEHIKANSVEVVSVDDHDQ